MEKFLLWMKLGSGGGRVLKVVGCVKGCCLDISSMWMCGVTRSGGVCGGAARPVPAGSNVDQLKLLRLLLAPTR